MKEKMDTFDLIKVKNFCSAKDIVKGMKRQAAGWEKIFAKVLSDKGMLSRPYKELSRLPSKTTTCLKSGQKNWMLHQRQYSDGCWAEAKMLGIPRLQEDAAFSNGAAPPAQCSDYDPEPSKCQQQELSPAAKPRSLLGRQLSGFLQTPTVQPAIMLLDI